MTWADSLTLEALGSEGTFTDGDWVETKDQDPAGGVRLTQLADVGEGSFRDRSNRWLREEQASRLGCTFLQPSDVLIARMPDPIARACLVPSSLGRAVTVVDAAVLRINRSDVFPKYVMWALNAPDFRRRAESLQGGTTRKRISRKNLAKLSIPVPSLREQRRIVEILEDHLSHLDAAARCLEDAERQSHTLMARHVSSAATGPLRTLSEMADIQGGIQKQPRRKPHENSYPFLRVANVTASGLALEDVHMIELFGQELERLRLIQGDLLVVEGNGSPSQIGRAALWDGSIPNCVHQNHLIRVRAKSSLLPEYLEVVWNAPKTRRALTDVSSSSSGLHTLSVGKLKTLALPIPTFPEQRHAIELVAEARRSHLRTLMQIDVNRRRSSQLRRALLAAAFSGKLTSRHTDQEVIEELAQ